MKVLVFFILVASATAQSSEEDDLVAPGVVDTPGVTPADPGATPGATPETPADDDDIGKLAVPVTYDLELSLNPEANPGNSFTGNVKITFKAIIATSVIKLHKDTSIIFDATNVKVNGVSVKEVTPNEDTDIVTITLNDELPVKSTNTLEISYQGDYSTDNFGIILGSYMQGRNTKNMILTQFHSIYARRAFPCWDLPKYKAEFNLTLSYPDRYKAISNQEADKADIVRLGTRTSFFKKTDIMAPHLLAFVISNLPTRSVTRDRKKYSFYGPVDDIGRKTNVAAEYAPVAMDYLGSYLKFPMNQTAQTKIDYVGTKYSVYGTMENWGLNTFEESRLFMDPNRDSNDREIIILKNIGKMSAMNWFGNLINYGNWDGGWISEGPSTMYAYQLAEALADDSWEMNIRFVANEVLRALDLDATLEGKALMSPAKKRDEIFDKYRSPLFLTKAPTITAVMKYLVGTDEFQRVMQNYFQTYKFKSVIPDDMLGLFGGLTGTTKTVKDIIKGYTEKPGFPLVTVAITDNKVTITQTRYLDSGDATGDAAIKYDIPITYLTKSTARNDVQRPQAWLLSSEDSKEIYTLTDADDWILLNNKKVGYYRVLYPKEMYTKISNAMTANIDNFHVLNRMQYVDDILHLIQSSKIDVTVGLEYLDFLKKETSPFVWQILFKFYETQIKTQPKDLLKLSMTTWITKRMKLFLSGVSLDVNNKDSPTYNLRRNLGIQYSIEFGNSSIINDINNLYSRHRRGGNIHVNLRKLIYSTALADSIDDDDWNFIYEKLQKSDSIHERSMLIGALAKTQNSALIEKLIVYVIGLKPDQGDAMAYLQTIMKSSLASRKAFNNFILQRSRIFSKRFGENRWPQILNMVSEAVNTAEDNTKVIEWVRKNKATLKYDDAKVKAFEDSANKKMESRTKITTVLKKAFCD